ncbi:MULTISPECIES: glutamyl-tRNA reductase [Bacillus]|uniref:Glutamyl-tRNA reductase n=12 Tax=Bacillus cereus group TaxID=86661 RepID=HEM1_BACAN|nr:MULTISPECIES: glutamyl-tRNA reductase [Bacillus]A0RJ83.1 RecName: Full=Glutamyl-tRNA reductase; Short=GluTR [Bacillus thuringiensis str. Al Hakam]B7JQ59.1 RecName: Full=Glutamyl-tRNA reductase; Short=GluTR [Bacillus cereus AH820]C3L6Z7.1 RecName: Full=Glutamyl-tRNA reductase; Short=GluTR [Bacillus anthracis str. CDC 684]C3P9F1.1 RecName: Full=Glutamyl-tRNA reductase; Short=GluTR [Bacillus anthracis str. A0248]Q6HD60.1 RecName: Full=Glutamyl-tRNA reductase; Short=GluTR [[Bacillus thuringiens
MHILVVSVNYRTAPVEFREKLTFQAAELERAMTTLQNQKSVLENVIVSTCNRTEIYAVVDQLHTGRYYIKKFLADWFQLEIEEVAPYLTIFEQDGAIDHLFRVTCGLDSMVVGETQILGQIKDSFLEAQQVKATGTIFNELFKQVITLAKRAHSETTIGESAMSVSYAAVELGKKIFGELTDCHVLILGAGKMGELALQNLYGSGARKVTVMNRTLSKAEIMAEKYMGHAKPLSELQCALLEADILISSTGASDYVITKEMMTKVEKMRSGRPLFMVDIAVPRDIDPAIDELEGSFLYDIDDLQGVVEANRAERLKEAEKIQFMIEEEIVLFKTWLSTLGVVPLISALRDKALAIQSETMESLERKIPNLSDRERKVISKHTKSIINQLLKDPILVAKEIAAEEGADEKLALFAKIFDLEMEDVESRAEEVEHKRVWTPSVPSL